MGLDAVVLLMDVEDHFGITIRDSELEPFRTVGDMVTFIQSRLETARESPCLTLPLFLRLRHVVREIAGEERLRIRPNELVERRLSASGRRLLWKRLPSLLDSPPRDLRRPTWLRWLMAAVTIPPLVASVLLALSIDPSILPLPFAVAGLVILVLLWVTKPLCSVPPDGWRTFGEITLHLVGTRAATKQLNLRTEDEILTELRPLIASTLGVKPAEVVFNARFIEDLGMS